MTYKETMDAIAQERERLQLILERAKVPRDRLEMLEPTVENTAWMKVKLDAARRSIRNAGITVKYDNGGGQKGTRKNPQIEAYEALWASYVKGLEKLMAALPAADAAGEAPSEAGKTMLDMIRAKRGVEA